MKIAITDLDANNPDDLHAAQSLLNHLLQRAGVPVSAPMPPIGEDAPDVGVDVQSPDEAFGAPSSPEAAFGLVSTPEQAFAPLGDAGNAPAAGSAGISTPTTAFSAPAAPSAPAAAAVAAAAPAPAVDSRGIPHDPRIHAGTKSVKANGEWTAKRGVDPALVAQVEAELRAFMGQPAAAPAAPALHPVAQQLAAAMGTPAAPPAPPAPPVAPNAPAVTGAATATAAPAGAAGTTDPYPAAVQKVAGYLQSGKLTQAELTAACMQYGAAQLPLFANRPDLLAQLVGHIDNLVMLKG